MIINFPSLVLQEFSIFLILIIFCQLHVLTPWLIEHGGSMLLSNNPYSEMNQFNSSYGYLFL